MPNRPNLSLDQQFFQELLSAAYTIQKHNDRLNDDHPSNDGADSGKNRLNGDRPKPGGLKSDRPAPNTPAQAILKAGSSAAPVSPPTSICLHCGAEKPAEPAQCERCGPENFRPGERMQRKWASMWLMSQQQGLFPERQPENQGAAIDDLPAPKAKGTPLPVTDSAVFGRYRSIDEKEAVRNASGQEAEAIPNLPNLATDPRTPQRKNGGALGKNLPAGKWAADTSKTATDAHLAEKQSVNNLPGKFRERGLQEPELPVGSLDVARDQSALSTNDDFSGPEHKRRDTTSLDQTSDPASHHSDSFDTGWVEPDSVEAGTSELDPSELDASERTGIFHRFADLRVKLRFHRADLYLGTAILVAAAALLWPVAGSTQQAGLSPWQRALVTIGLAEAPAPQIHVLGDPAIEVWVDPHTALYYCPGDDLYGKTSDGRFNSQREAQMDRFEPASRNACE